MRLVIALGLVVGLVGCGGFTVHSSDPVELDEAQIAKIETAAANAMRDPASAQFRNIRAAEIVINDQPPAIHVCGELNARNGFGGYAGFKTFSGVFDEDGEFVYQMIDSPNDRIETVRRFCVEHIGL